MKIAYEDRYGESRDQGDIKAVVQTQCGGSEGLKEAMDRGDVFTKIKNGREMYFRTSVAAVRKCGIYKMTKLNKGSRALTFDEAEAVSDVLDSFQWSVKLPKSEEKRALANDDEVSPSMLSKLQEAKSMVEKVVRECATLLEKNKDKKLRGSGTTALANLKAAIKACKDSLHTMDRAIVFQEDSEDAALTNTNARQTLFKSATKLSALYEAQQVVKTHIRMG